MQWTLEASGKHSNLIKTAAKNLINIKEMFFIWVASVGLYISQSNSIYSGTTIVTGEKSAQINSSVFILLWPGKHCNLILNMLSRSIHTPMAALDPGVNFINCFAPYLRLAPNFWEVFYWRRARFTPCAQL